MGKLAILLAVALLTASVQCVAVCTILPCKQSANNPAPAGDCHHRIPAPDDPHSGTGSEPGCGHQTFLSEAAPQVNTVLFDAAVVGTVPMTAQWEPELRPVAAVSLDWSPPPRISSTSISILRL